MSSSRVGMRLGMSLLAVSSGCVLLSIPLYDLYCKSKGVGGIIVSRGNIRKAVEGGREITVDFLTSTSPKLDWKFSPCQKSIKCKVGESTLVFFRVTNSSNRPIKGIASYDMLPPEAGLYFNKIQCFCFDEQLLKPQETIDMPLLFIVDPEFENEPALYKKDRITLAYKFFESHDGFEVPLPNFIKDL